MEYTAEIRWFIHSTEQEHIITDWFKKHGQHFYGRPSRADVCLRLRNLTTHGVRIRSGILEIKALTHDWGIINLPGSNTGTANMWGKYNFTLAGGDDEAKEVLASFSSLRAIGINNDWMRLDKERLLVKYAIDPDLEKIVMVNDEAMPEQGCNVEYTKMRINFHRDYCSFGFEAFGKGVNVKKNLDIAVNEVFASMKISGLTEDTSLTYPKFLASVT